MLRTAILSAALTAGLLPAAPLSAQQTQELPPPVTLRGRLLDAERRTPVAGAVVRQADGDAATVTDAAGFFALEVAPAGAYVLRIEQLGYEASQVVLPSTAPLETTEVLLQPRPVELKGFEVTVAGPLRQRRTLSARPVEVLGPVEVAELGGMGTELFRRALPLTRLCQHPDGELCFFRRGQPQPVRICIDEQPAYEGASDLESLRPWEIHSIEVFDRGTSIRVYTRAFMARLMERDRPLRPLEWCWSGAAPPGRGARSESAGHGRQD